jgi:N6-adenosine-specific RNA methylase IME4
MKYEVIYADVPWKYQDRAQAGNRGAEFKYPCMSTKDICSLPVSSLAADNCALFFWATMPMIPDAMKVIDSWGFKYKTNAFTWIKMNKKATDTVFWGMGHYTRANTELCFLATRGKVKRVSSSVHSVIMSPIEGHSKKPDEARSRIVKLMGDVPRIELFARQAPSGWDVLGNEVGDGMDIRQSILSLDDS